MAGTVWRCNIAASLDGKTARPDGSVDCVAADFPAGASGFGAFLAAVDAILMDRATCEAVRRHGDRPYSGKPAVVMTTRLIPGPPDGAETRSGDVAEVAAELEERGTAACGSWAAGRRSVR